jgi:hypothetical protein
MVVTVVPLWGHALGQTSDAMPALLQQRLNLGDLVDAGDPAAGESGDLAIDHGSFLAHNILCRDSQVEIDVEAPLVDESVKLPKQLLVIR